MASQKRLSSKVLVCQNTTCKQQGSPQVTAAFERCVPGDVTIEVSGCLGQCGNGPMVIVLQAGANGSANEGAGADREKTWYAGVKPAEAFAIASQHFKDDASLSRKQTVSPQTEQGFFWIWLVGLVLFFAMCGLMALVLGGPSHYG